MAITEPVQVKLDQNIQEGFAQFEKVQQHSKNAEEQLREVGGHSINDLNNLPNFRICAASSGSEPGTAPR